MIILAICVSALLLSSCHIRWKRDRSWEGIRWEEKEPQQILDQLKSEQEKITDFTAGFSIILDPPPQGQPANLQGVIYYARSEKGPLIRIKSLSAFGQVLFDLIKKGNTVQIYVPSRRTLYNGAIEKDNGNSWQNIFSNLFADFSRMTIQESSYLELAKGSVIIRSNNGSLYLDPDTGYVRKWEQEQHIIYYDDYLSTPGQPPFPKRIQMKASDSETETTCVFNQMQINKGIQNGFDLSEYQPEFKRDINELNP
jgi:hypothetical protein